MKLRIADAAVGVVLGALVLFIWWVVRSDVYPLDPTAGLVLIALLFVSAGLIGTLRSGSFAGGIRVGLAAGLVGSLTVPAEYLLLNSHEYGSDATSMLVSMTASAAVVLFLAAAGSALTTMPRHAKRLGRAIHGFAAGWKTAG
jgi:hypothetical protein